MFRDFMKISIAACHRARNAHAEQACLCCIDGLLAQREAAAVQWMSQLSQRPRDATSWSAWSCLKLWYPDKFNQIQCWINVWSSCSQRSHISRLENDISLGQSLPFWGGCWYTSRFLGPRGIWRLFALESSRYPMSSRKWRGARTQMPGGAEPQMRWRREAMENVEAKPETSRDGWKMMCFFVSMFIYRRVTINHQPNWCV